MNIRIILSGFALTLLLGAYGQDSASIDSMALALKKIGLYNLRQSRSDEARNDLTAALNLYDSIGNNLGRISVYRGIARAYTTLGDYRKATENTNAALNIAREFGYDEQILQCFYQMVRMYAKQGNPAKELDYQDSALHFSKEIWGDYGVVQHRNRIGDMKQTKGKYQESFEQYQSALAIAEEHGFKKEIAASYYGISMIYQFQGNYPEALKNLEIAMNIKTEIGDSANFALLLRQLGNINFEIGNIQDALTNYLTALEISNKYGRVLGTAALYHNIGMIHELQGNYLNAEENYIKAIKIRDEAGLTIGVTITKIYLGNLYTKLKRLKEARKQFEEVLQLTKTGQYNSTIPQLYHGLAMLDSAEGNFAQALEHYKLYVVYKDSVSAETNSKHLAELEVRFETEMKDRELDLLNAEKELKDQQLEKQRLIRNGLIAGTTLLMLIVLFVFRSFRLRKKLEKQQAIIQERKRISADLHDDVGSGLSKIILTSERVKKEAITPETRKEAQKIAAISQELSSNISEIIWALNSNNDYVENMVAYIRRYAAEYFENSSIKLTIYSSIKIPDTPISGECRRNMFYSVKEALHNIMKHAQATEAELRFAMKHNVLSITLQDNGKGFSYGGENSFGNGLKNMRHRMRSINGNFMIENHTGTKITLSLPV